MSEQRPRIIVSLVALNQRKDLEQLLPTLMPAAHKVNARVLLTDNRSTDGTFEWLKEQYPEIDVVRNDRVTGYGGNHNINLRRSPDCDYFLIMNTDMALLDEETLLQLSQRMEASPDIGMLTVRLLNEDGSQQYHNKRHPAFVDFALRFLSRFLARSSWAEKRNNIYEMHDVGYENDVDVPFITGAFMFCRYNVLKKVGGFDERFFMYLEDDDLCRKLQHAGYRTVYTSGISVQHTWERQNYTKLRNIFFFVRSIFKLFNKWGWRLA